MKTKTLNEVSKSSIQMKLAMAVQREDMTQGEAAAALEMPVVYLSLIRNKNRWDKVPDKRWEQALKWVNSGQTLKEYAVKHGRVLPEKYEEKKEEAGKKLAEVLAEAGEEKQKREEHEADIIRENNEYPQETQPIGEFTGWATVSKAYLEHQADDIVRQALNEPLQIKKRNTPAEVFKEATITMSYFNEVTRQHREQVDKLLAERAELKEFIAKLEPSPIEATHELTDACPQKFVIDLEINILINGKKFNLA